MSKRPAFQFYPSDWRQDPALRLCSMAARGLWIDLMCLMHEGEPYGYLTANSRPIPPEKIAKLVGETANFVKKTLRELIDNGVCSVDENGAIFSRRMVRDEKVRNARAAGGLRGAEHGVKGAEHGSKGGRPRKDKGGSEDVQRGDIKPPLKPPPSSSSSSSPSEEPPVVPQGDDEFELTAEQPAAPDDVQVAFDEWNALAARIGLPTARTLSDDRRRAIKGRLKVGGLDLWRDALKAVEASAFLRGQRAGSNGQPFKADLAFVCQAKSFARLVDGGYGQDARAGQSRGEDDYVRRQLEALL